MKFGIVFANAGPWGLPENAAALGEAAEEFGVESLWTVEHVVVPKGYQSAYPYSSSGRMPGGEDAPIPDPLVWLSYVAATTSTVRLCTGVIILPQRNPLLLAKEVATLDVLSGGRVTLGVGVGWLEEEFDALGVPFAERGARTDDIIEALRAAWTQDPASHDSAFQPFKDVHVRPAPVQSGGVPIVIGGHTPAAARRAGRLGDGFFPARGDLDALPGLLREMRDTAAAAGRDPNSIEVTTGGAMDLDGVRRYADAGVHRLVIPPLAFDPAGLRDGLARFHDAVISKLA
ncbi:MAG TPA: LLM class F420-dependent oxidoreductase [Acidimicrobiales bacterium]|nr:LLM class F420-dependent oxidoreductase [Acidimicrobiales bacterium]